jgi:hypothetical protein
VGCGDTYKIDSRYPASLNVRRVGNTYSTELNVNSIRDCVWTRGEPVEFLTEERDVDGDCENELCVYMTTHSPDSVYTWTFETKPKLRLAGKSAGPDACSH